MPHHRYDEGQSENKKTVLFIFLNKKEFYKRKSNVMESFYSAIGIVNTETYETLLCSGSVIG